MKHLMYLLLPLSFFAATGAQAANTFFLAQFAGSHSVIKRTCEQNDSVCNASVKVELIQIQDFFLLNEYDSNNRKIISNELKQSFSDLVSTTLGGFDGGENSGFTGMWNLLEKDFHGVQIRTEAIFFHFNSIVEPGPIEFKYTSWTKASRPEDRDIRHKRSYVLAR